MVESDHSDMESQDEMPPLEVSENSIDVTESGKKRLREEISEDENIDIDRKKLCTSVDVTSTEHKSQYDINVNGTDEHITDNIKDISINNMQDKDQSLAEGNADEIVKKSNVEINETKNYEVSYSNDVAVKKENDSAISKITKDKGYATEEFITTTGKNAPLKEETKGEENDKIESGKKCRKSQIQDAEVVEGLELSVECASDKESSSSSDSDRENDKKPIPKTIIIKAKPNDSELDVSSSEVEKSDSQDASEIKTKQTIKKGKKKGKTSFSKTKSTDSEENNDVSDEDYSPRSKKKLKKTMINKRSTRSPTESKRGRGRAKKVNKKSVRKEDEEEENSNIAEDKKSDASNSESEQTKSEDESDNADSSNDRKRQSSKSENNKKIQLFKKYIRMTGIHVKSYNDLWADCKSNSARILCLKTLLKKNGVSGRPSIEKCKKAKERNERLKDVAELNTSNIISEGRITRAQRNKDFTKESSKSPEMPAKRTAYKRVLTLVDSDSE